MCRIIQLFDETGTVKKRDYPENFGTKKLGDIEKLLILQIVIEKLGFYLEELLASFKKRLVLRSAKQLYVDFFINQALPYK